ncbi:hypothetical protein NM688_g2252 [Phlebia brevispora]|uniref:Uncharacterized protein n=1 Tax=Phlebia brevispora TaxID=194682 RepID=A0ACC1T910_9APHY|nr:hypothetical protein NM688_g2252 [Phlebia brevispora]
MIHGESSGWYATYKATATLKVERAPSAIYCNDMSIEKKLRVAIIGGGIAGLTFAICLAKNNANVDVDIYESGPEFSTNGAGLGMWPRIWAIMKELGLEEELRRRSTALTGDDRPFMYCKADQAKGHVFAQSMSTMEPYHRAEFLQILCENAPKQLNKNFGKKLDHYVDNPPDPIIMHFRDGTTASCDILVGADGVKSAVRRTMYNHLADKAPDREAAEALRREGSATWTGQVAYRHLISADELRKSCPDHPGLRQPIIFSGENRYLICYPISQGRIVNCAALVSQPQFAGTLYEGPSVSMTSQEELLVLYKNWEPRAQAVLDLMVTPSKWVINSVESLPTFVAGRVAILGDAAHAMTPHQASGAGQAVEDAMVLSMLLAQRELGRKTAPIALQVYDEVRRPFTQSVVRGSLQTGKNYYFQSPLAQEMLRELAKTGAMPTELLNKIGDETAEQLRWTWSTTIKGDQDYAVEMFKTRVAQRG